VRSAETLDFRPQACIMLNDAERVTVKKATTATGGGTMAANAGR
jgi:hypothetical protein